MALPEFLHLNNIAKCIEDKTASFMIGISQARKAGLVPICVGHTPDEAPPNHITILERVGGSVNGQLPEMVDFHIQIIARADTYFKARDYIWECFNELHGSCCRDIEYAESAGAEEAFVTIDALASPGWLDVDEKGRFQFSCNFVWSYRNPSGGGWI